MTKFHPRSEFLETMDKRGFLADATDFQQLDFLLRRECVPAYIGFDATAPSLHVGSLIQIMMLRWLQKSGHRPIVLMGGGTTKVGDPSFRSSERPLLDPQQIDRNIEGIKSVFSKYISFGEGSTGAILANNAEWLDSLNYLDFLREVGRYFSVNRMLSFDSVKSRLGREQSLSFLEFNYMILQAYDFLELSRRHGCRLQMGGSDQWGNIVNGVDLTRRIENLQVFGLTSPLLTTSSGAKMGKTAGGAVWLNPDMCSPYEFWQYWRSVDDADVLRFLLLFTEIPIDECHRLGTLGGSEINESKIALANSVTELAHGKEASRAAAATAHEVFELGGTGEDLPRVELDPDQLREGKISVVQVFVLAGLSESGKAGRRLIAGGGARIDDKTVADPGQMLLLEDLKNPIKLSAGKKRHAIIALSGRYFAPNSKIENDEVNERAKILVKDALGRLSLPYDEDVTDRVLGTIENDLLLRAEYRDVKKRSRSGRAFLNQCIGSHVAEITGGRTKKNGVLCKLNRLATTYSKRDFSSIKK